MAPKKKRGKARAKPAAAAARPGPAEEDDEEEEGLSGGAGGAQRRDVIFGARWMLFRSLLLAGAAVSFAQGEGNAARIIAGAAAAGAVWARCGSDGRAGKQKHHFADSRVHRYAREVGFRRSNQTEIDGDERSRAVYAQLRQEVNQVKSHLQRVKNFAGRCDAREVDVRNGGRWRSMEELARYMAQGAMMSEAAIEAAGTGADPIFDLCPFRPVCGRRSRRTGLFVTIYTCVWYGYCNGYSIGYCF